LAASPVSSNNLVSSQPTTGPPPLVHNVVVVVKAELQVVSAEAGVDETLAFRPGAGRVKAGEVASASVTGGVAVLCEIAHRTGAQWRPPALSGSPLHRSR
jgi:hypothetical protein